MENVENDAGVIASYDKEISAKNLNESDCKMQPAVDIVDHYASRKISESSDSTQPIRPPRKCSDYLIESLPSSRKSSDSMDSSPMKPSRKLSQASANRKFSTCSEISIRTPKKVSFSDELPLHSGMLSSVIVNDEQQNETSDDLSMEMTDEQLESLESTLNDNDNQQSDEYLSDNGSVDNDFPSASSSISTQTVNELTKADMFPNSRKVSLHSERSFDMSPMNTLRPGTESATTQITTDTESEVSTPMDAFLENERKMSTSSVRSK